MDSTATVNGHEPIPVSADAFRNALIWYYEVGPGLVFKCRHLGFQDLIFLGSIPTPVIESFASHYPGSTVGTILESPHRRAEILEVARAYAMAVVLEPKVVAPSTPDGPPPDPAALVVTDVPDGIWLGLMDAGLARRLAINLGKVGLFRSQERSVPAPDRSDGSAVPDPAESLAVPAGSADETR
jgi:hypothetical protein